MSRAAYDFDAAYRRMLEATGTDSQTALAAALGIKQPTFWDARKRGVIPASWLVVLVERYGLSPLWVKAGEGPMHLSRSLQDVPLEDLTGEIGRRISAAFSRIGAGVTRAPVEK